MASEDEMLGLASVLAEFNTASCSISNMGAHTLDDIDWFARWDALRACRCSGAASTGWQIGLTSTASSSTTSSTYFREGLRL